MSGLGWGLGYIGGILALVLVVVLNAVGWFGLDVSDGLAYRLIAVGCAVWTIVFAIPFFVNVPEAPANEAEAPLGFFASYGRLVRDIGALFRDHRSTFWFLIASAVFRDGLAGVFAFGGVLAARGVRLLGNEVIIFAIAAERRGRRRDDPRRTTRRPVRCRPVIIAALSILIVSCLFVFFFREQGKMCSGSAASSSRLLVGPAQASSRSLLARVTPAGHARARSSASTPRPAGS